MKNRARLFRVKDPFDTQTTDGLFMDAMRENCRFQYHHCGEYRAILKDRQFDPESLVETGDLASQPFIPTHLFNNHKN